VCERNLTSFSQQLETDLTLSANVCRQKRRVWLSSLKLDKFRNYRKAELAIQSGQLVILGENGSGKTNLLEAVSMLAPGRGMRRARSYHIACQDPVKNIDGRLSSRLVDDCQMEWAVSCTLETDEGSFRLGTGLPRDSVNGSRTMRLDGKTVPQMEIGNRFSVSWLTPQMDGIFIDSPSARRRFLDRLVVAFDPSHIGRMSRYEKALRQRAQLFSDGSRDDAWYLSLEAVIAETAVAVTAARQALIKALNEEAFEGWYDFPGVALSLSGEVETWLNQMPALEVEDNILIAAKTARAKNESSMPGPHVSEFQAMHLTSKKTANLASTGQQKAMLISIILAHARLQGKRLGRAPVILFDDITAHLDSKRRSTLFEAMQSLGGQCWYSGTDEIEFSDLRREAQFVRVAPSNEVGMQPEFEVI